MISLNLQLKLLRQVFCGYSKKFSCFRKVLMTDLHFKALEYFSSSRLRSLACLLINDDKIDLKSFVVTEKKQFN